MNGFRKNKDMKKGFRPSPANVLFNPIRDKQVGKPGAAIVAVG